MRISRLEPIRVCDLSGWCVGNLELHMRWTLFNWLIDVGSTEMINLNTSCFLLCFSLIDRFLYFCKNRPASTPAFDKSHLHILGVTALFVATKMHGDNIPSIDDFLYYLDDMHYVDSHLISMEKQLFKSVDFVFYTPFPPSSSSNGDNVEITPHDKDKLGEMLCQIPIGGPVYVLLFEYLVDLSLLDHKVQGYSHYEIQILSVEICLALANLLNPQDELQPASSFIHATWRNLERKQQGVSSFLDVIYDEKLRIETGKRTAIQRKYTRTNIDLTSITVSCTINSGGYTILNMLFENLPRLKSVLLRDYGTGTGRSQRNILTRSQTSGGLGLNLPTAVLTSPRQFQNHQGVLGAESEEMIEDGFYLAKSRKKRKREVAFKHHRQSRPDARARCEEITAQGRRCKLPVMKEGCDFCVKHV